MEPLNKSYDTGTFSSNFTVNFAPTVNGNLSAEESQRLKQSRQGDQTMQSATRTQTVHGTPVMQSNVAVLERPEQPPQTTLPPPYIPVLERPTQPESQIPPIKPSSGIGFREFLTGMFTGGIVRLSTKQTLLFAGLYGWPMTLTAGAVSGGIIAGIADFCTQYKAAQDMPATKQILWTNYVEMQRQQNRSVDATQVMQQANPEGYIDVPTEKSTFKNVMHKLGQVEKCRFAKAILKGAALGLAGAAVSALAIDLIDGLVRNDIFVGFRIPGTYPTPSGNPIPWGYPNPPEGYPNYPGYPYPVPPGYPTPPEYPSFPGYPTPPNYPTPPGYPSFPGYPNYPAPTYPYPYPYPVPTVPPGLAPPNFELPPGVTPPNVFPPGTPFASEIQNLPVVVDLPQGSTVWGESSRVLQQILHRPPTNAEILRVAQEVCRQSSVTVPEWGITGTIFHTQMPVGYDVIFNNSVKNVIAQIALGR